MKKQISLFFVLTSLLFAGCIHIHGGSTDVTFTESGRYFSMKARFNANRTKTIEQYMDQQLGSQTSMSFVNTRIDGRISFDGETSLYIRKYPGYLQIKLDKDQNSPDSYHHIREMCEGIKDLLAN
jgi:hypothetical protein